MSNRSETGDTKQFGFEFQTVLLAAGRGSRLNQLLHGKPKCLPKSLLPIANKPMIQYPLELLVRHHIREVIIIVLDNEEDQIKSSINRMELDIQLEYVTIPHSDDFGTADSLRRIKNKLKKDILLLSCDLITDLNINQMIEMYRLKNASFLCLLSSIRSEKENLLPVNKLENNKEFDYIGLDANDSSRIVFFEPDAIFTESIPFKRSLLQWCPNFAMHTDLMDSHIYMFQNWILDYLVYKCDIHSIKLDLLPSLVRKQFRIRKKSQKESNSVCYDSEQTSQNVKNIFNFINISQMERYLSDIELQDPFQIRYPQSLISCTALIVESGYCLRVNNLLRFCEANRILVEQNLLVGQGFLIGEKTVIKRTVIGNNCCVKNNVTLINCILQDNVTVEDGCQLFNSLVCTDVHIGSKAYLENCIIGPKQKVSSRNHYKNESLFEEILEY